ncbi:MAG TPA: hypothetical protein VK013_15850 [Myxococcaceae bacterium]|nr:hypothetical protein [Myxococcaceae bacterium]
MSPPDRFRRASRFCLAILSALVLSACGEGSAGLPCERTRECPSGQTCWTRVSEQLVFPEGFCTRTCDTPGERAGCPSGNVCALTADRSLCAPTCDPSGDVAAACGDGLACAPADEGDGPAACVLRP